MPIKNNPTMNKSKIYKYAQIAVMNHSGFSSLDKLEVLRELMSREDIEKYMETLKGDDECEKA